MATEVLNGEVPVQNGDVDSTELDAEMPTEHEQINGLDEAGKPIRLIRKAKRLNRTNSGGDATSSNGNAVEKIPALKNSRKSRDGRGRGEPKKGTKQRDNKTLTLHCRHLYMCNKGKLCLYILQLF